VEKGFFGAQNLGIRNCRVINIEENKTNFQSLKKFNGNKKQSNYSLHVIIRKRTIPSLFRARNPHDTLIIK